MSLSSSNGGLIANLAASSLSIKYNESGTTIISITVPASTSAGKYIVVVTGQNAGGSLSHSANITIQVIKPDFSIYGSPGYLSIVSGQTATTQICLYSLSWFNGTVSLTEQCPSGWTDPVFVSSLLKLSYGGSATTGLTIAVPYGTSSGQYTITVIGEAAGGLSHPVTLTVYVLNPNFNMYTSPSNLYLIAGTTGNSIITCSPTDRFNGTITLTTQAPGGWSTTLPTTLAIDYAHHGKTTLSISVPLGTFDGKYSITATGTCGALTRSVTITVQIITPDIALQSSPSLTTIRGGAAGNVTIGVVALGRYNGTITLSATGPDGWTATFYKPTFNVAYNHTTDSSKMLITIPTGTAPGKYNILVTANGDQLSLTDTISVTVIAK